MFSLHEIVLNICTSTNIEEFEIHKMMSAQILQNTLRYQLQRFITFEIHKVIFNIIVFLNTRDHVDSSKGVFISWREKLQKL